MQYTHLSTRDFRDERKNIGICKKPASSNSDGLAFRQLLAASKEAEALIGCLFELHFITAAPLRQIWDELAVAIESAQRSLQAQH
jgi:hypothetical protein